MKADELLKISIENSRPIEELVKNFENGAKAGYTHYIHHGYLSTETVSKLGNMGFRVRRGPIQ